MSCYANPIVVPDDREGWTRLMEELEHYHYGQRRMLDMRSVRPVGDPLPSYAGTLPVRGSEAGPNEPRPEEAQRGDL